MQDLVTLLPSPNGAFCPSLHSDGPKASEPEKPRLTHISTRFPKDRAIPQHLGPRSSWLKLTMLDTQGGDKPLDLPDQGYIITHLRRILETVGRKEFEHSINLYGHDVLRMISISENWKWIWIAITMILENGGWNLRMILFDQDTVFLGLEQRDVTAGKAIVEVSRQSVVVKDQVTSTVHEFPPKPAKLHPRIRQLKVIPTKRQKIVRVKLHGKVIQTRDPRSWSDTAILGVSVDPAFRRIQKRRKGCNAKEYLALSRRVLGLKVKRLEEYGRTHPLHPKLSDCILRYRMTEHLMKCRDCENEIPTKGTLVAAEPGTLIPAIAACDGLKHATD